MRPAAFVFIMSLGFSGLLHSCSSGESSRVANYQLIRPELHLGEYLTPVSQNAVITVSRDLDNPGLVRVTVPTGELEVLDATANEARDIFVQDSKIIYRVNDEIRLFNEKPIKLLQPALKIWSFSWAHDLGRITYDISKQESHWMTFRADGTVVAEGLLTFSPKHSLLLPNQEEWTVGTDATGLVLWRFLPTEKEPQWVATVDRGITTNYVSSILTKAGYFIFYMDEETGVLKLASRSQTTENFSIEVVEGRPHQTYVGMDIAPFDDGDHPGALYLDGWKLKLHLARFRNSTWQTEELPIQGAVGFYTKVLSQSEQDLEIVTHNFRSVIDTYETSFEDLACATIRLK